MAYVVALLLKHHTALAQPASHLDAFERPGMHAKSVRFTFLLLTAVVVALLWLQSLPWTYYLYCLTPVLLLHQVTQQRRVFTYALHSLIDKGFIMKTILYITMTAVAMECIVWSFFNRSVLSVLLVSLALWPLSTTLLFSHKVNDFRFFPKK